MSENLKEFAGKVKEAVSTAAHLVGDLNGDGKVDIEDAKIAAEWAKKQARMMGDEAARVGKEALRSDMVKDAAAGAAVGAAIAVPIPVIGPLAGAAVGAGLGVYKNLNKNESKTQEVRQVKDIHAELLKLDDLRKKGIITESEFESQKKFLLSN